MDRDMPSKTSTHITEQFSGDALLSIREVGPIVGLGPSAIYARIARGEFPAPRRLSARCSRWKASELKSWLAAL